MMRMLLLMVVLAAVWYLWKTITEQKAAVEADESADAAGKAAAEADPTTPRPEEVAETAECPQCRAYVSIHAQGGCGREDCPIPELAAAAAGDEPAEAGEPPRDGQATAEGAPAEPPPGDRAQGDRPQGDETKPKA